MTKTKSIAKKITKEELERVIELTSNQDNLLRKLGTFEAEKHSLLHMLAQLNERIKSDKEFLQEKYGNVNIDLSDGSLTKNEEK